MISIYLFCFADFAFSSDTCGGGGGRGSSVDQDSLGGGLASEEHEVASLTTLHIDSETSSLSHTVTVTGTYTSTKTFKKELLNVFITMIGGKTNQFFCHVCYFLVRF